ncbi:MAG: chorismate mutase [Pseudanabaena sp.]|nr:chorismate mutase [Pseudanabaena sp. M53BS1SP1A06MG]MCA6581640.1 chorismate mutase [Pseudanabaena sp. M34BS1SP1A06MG]MCA6586531.1 chorismate mutase [Pseudanabaena sp. M051S1SP1A06QC]MCA6588843.1 chorismate mutase [Pseudanabaena sp. M109S1SP1A06QC]MCA6593414.1 chorismate mutase [Pseudanabaena sp. M38BS1SP1A06MG]MCA6596125.1 chorismate mutase [Pseudanabaena sp. M046S1SP1A06QC]MCA6602286.1 chorismate mutase [Pseudanabaena sp. M57BS1SP1A06MG]MCA6606683.1 chorismate mutase [Pseudanabaena sp. M
MGWRVRGVRGATTVEANTYAALERAVLELMEEIEAQNDIDPSEIVSATFSATTDIDVVFPAKIARSRSHWEHVPLLDVQQMYVEGSLERCIRVLIHVNTPLEQHQIKHIYLNGARDLRPDLVYAQI